MAALPPPSGSATASFEKTRTFGLMHSVVIPIHGCLLNVAWTLKQGGYGVSSIHIETKGGNTDTAGCRSACIRVFHECIF